MLLIQNSNLITYILHHWQFNSITFGVIRVSFTVDNHVQRTKKKLGTKIKIYKKKSRIKSQNSCLVIELKMEVRSNLVLPSLETPHNRPPFPDDKHDTFRPPQILIFWPWFWITYTTQWRFLIWFNDSLWFVSYNEFWGYHHWLVVLLYVSCNWLHLFLWCLIYLVWLEVGLCNFWPTVFPIFGSHEFNECLLIWYVVYKFLGHFCMF